MIEYIWMRKGKEKLNNVKLEKKINMTEDIFFTSGWFLIFGLIYKITLK